MNHPMRRISKLLLASALCGAPFATLLVPQPVQAELPAAKKVAMVDLQRVLSETKGGKAAKLKLEKSSVKKQKTLEKKQQRLEADAAKLQNLSGAEAAAAQEKLQREYMELQQMYYALQSELAEQEGKLLETMYKNSQAIVQKIAKEKDIDLVLVRDPSTVIFVEAAFDITDEVIKRYDKKHR